MLVLSESPGNLHTYVVEHVSAAHSLAVSQIPRRLPILRPLAFGAA
jgi:hypothetical protein